MRFHTAPLTLTASLTVVLAGALGNSAMVRAEPVTIRIVDAANLSASIDQWPLSPHRQAPSPAEPGQPAPESLVADRPPAATPTGAPTSSAASTATALATENGDWERELKDAIRPLYDELAGSGVVDAVSSLKSALGQIAGESSDSASAMDYAVAHDAATRELDASLAPRSAAQLENERRLTARMLDELIAAIKPWLLSLLALYLLWLMTRLTLDYSRWKSRRAVKRGSRKSRRPRHRHGARSSAQAHVARSAPPP